MIVVIKRNTHCVLESRRLESRLLTARTCVELDLLVEKK